MKFLLLLLLATTVSAKQVTLEWPQMTDEATGLYLMEAVTGIGPRLITQLPPDAIEWTGEFPVGSYNLYLVPYNFLGMLGIPSEVFNLTIKTRIVESTDDLNRWTEESRFEEIDRPRRFYRVIDAP